MEKEELLDNIQDKTIPIIFPSPHGFASNWSLLSTPLLEPFPPPPLSFSSACTSLPAASSAHVLRTKVKSVTQRKQRGRERCREQADTDVQPKREPTGQLPCQPSLKPRVPAKGAGLPEPRPLSLSEALGSISAGEGNVEGEEPGGQGVRLRLELHSPSAEARRGLAMASKQGDAGNSEESERSPGPPGQPRGLGEGASLESLLPDGKPGGRKLDPLTPPALPLLSITSSSCPNPPPPPSPSPPTHGHTPSSPLLSASSPTPPPAPPPPPASSSSSSRPWAPPKGFWRAVRPETLLLNGLDPLQDASGPPCGPHQDQAKNAKEEDEEEAKGAAAWGAEPQQRSNPRAAAAAGGVRRHWKFQHSDSLERYWDQSEPSPDSASSPSSPLSSQSELPEGIRERARAEAKPRVGGRSKVRVRGRSSREEREQGGPTEAEGACGTSENDSDWPTLSQGPEPHSSLLFMLPDELPMSPRHEQAKRLLERARMKARCNHGNGDRPARRAHSEQRCNAKQLDPPASPPARRLQQQQPIIRAKEEGPTALASAPPPSREEPQASCLAELGARPRRNGASSSPTRVRFQDESRNEAQSRYLDRVRERGRTGKPRSKDRADASAGPPDSRGRDHHRSTSMPASHWRQEESMMSVGGANTTTTTTTTTTTVVKEIIVVVEKCEACGSVVRIPPSGTSDAACSPAPPPPAPPTSQPPSSQPVPPPPAAPPAPATPPPAPPSAPQQRPAGSAEDARAKGAPRSSKPQEAGARPKQPLTVTFAGAFVLGEGVERDGRGSSSGFGKLRRRSLKGQSRLESGNGPYGASWVQRRNSNPRNRTLGRRAVSFAPGSPVDLEHRVCQAAGEAPGPALPIRSALKSSSKNRAPGGQPSGQSGASGEDQAGAQEGCGSQHADPPETAEARREGPLAPGAPAVVSLAPCLRPSSLKYAAARLTPDLPAAELWDAAPEGTGLSLSGDPGCEGRPRGQALSRAEDLRAELLRAEHLKAEAQWDEIADAPRKNTAERDGRPKLSLRRFFSSIGLNSVGKLVKGSRSSSMEQLSLPAGPGRGAPGSPSPSPTRRHQPPVRLQRTPSLQSLQCSASPLAQLRKASSVQSLERKTERSTLLGEVQIPYGLVPSPVQSPQVELRRGPRTDDASVLSGTLRPVGKVAQAFPDGTLLLELTRPPNEPFGFLISRGKGRADTGVYIEKVGGGGDGPYVGLLAVGDEILQVNGEPVAGLTLDQVTRLMTRDESTACLRVMPCRRGGPSPKPRPLTGHAL